MTGPEILEAIEHLNDLSTLEQIAARARKRISARATEIRRDALAKLWEEVKAKWQPSERIYCCARGTFLGGPYQRGDSVVITKVYRRGRRHKGLFARGSDGEEVWLSVNTLLRYDFKLEPPDDPMSPEARFGAKVAGDIIAGLSE